LAAEMALSHRNQQSSFRRRFGWMFLTSSQSSER